MEAKARLGRLLLVLLIAGWSHLGTALQCYNCHSASSNSSCHNQMDAFNANSSSPFAEQCNQEQNFCVIEEFTEGIETFGFIRGCSDNKSYSFPLEYPINLKLPPRPNDVINNRTVCTDIIMHVCVTLCQTDFCNGPLKPMTTVKPESTAKPAVSNASLCYHCRDSGINPDCRNHDLLFAAGQDMHEGSLVSACPKVQPYCIVLDFIKDGLSIDFTRSCSNGTNYPTTFDRTQGRLASVYPDNITMCTFNSYLKGVICATLCSGNLCNGPKVSSAISWYPLPILTPLAVLSFLLHLLTQ